MAITEIVFVNGDAVRVNQRAQEVYDGLAEAQTQGTLVTFMESSRPVGRVDVNPGAVAYTRLIEED